MGQMKHWSDCAVHNEPAYPAGECSCGGYYEDERPTLRSPFPPPIRIGLEPSASVTNKPRSRSAKCDGAGTDDLAGTIEGDG